MIVSINQPAYLPWLGYFDRVAASDVRVVLDHVQFEKNSFTNRNKVRTAAGWCWLTVPVSTSGKFGCAIEKLEIAPGRDWRSKHWESLRMNYTRAEHFADHAKFFDGLFRREWRLLKPLMDEITAYLLAAFEIRTPLVFSSDLKPVGTKSDLVLNICRELKATRYLSGPLGKDYLDEAAFERAGIAVEYHRYNHPTYPQAFPGFEPNMAAVDLLFNCGTASSRILRNAENATPAAG